jgi:hypothetical protein
VDPTRRRCFPTGTVGHAEGSSKPGGRAPVAACHAAAAPRSATIRDTAAPTPNETDHTSASSHRTPRVAGLAGGSSWRLARQSAFIPRGRQSQQRRPTRTRASPTRDASRRSHSPLSALRNRISATALRRQPAPSTSMTRPGAEDPLPLPCVPFWTAALRVYEKRRQTQRPPEVERESVGAEREADRGLSATALAVRVHVRGRKEIWGRSRRSSRSAARVLRILARSRCCCCW